ncbi:hypothetical protein B0H17DRAFT_1127579 [Mycena rosella]|uniref:Uncharacterized protein n=1 Tax=Mycena rosella TaxID=1033263 RepID=A0AAD7E065_MYCRO|nr:hypothetical protein B0H17DRAFT_1127579 [Mycena rosella]
MGTQHYCAEPWRVIAGLTDGDEPSQYLSSVRNPEKPEIWKDHMCVDGGARAWIEGNRMNSLPSYTGMTPEVVEHERKALLKGGLTAPLCWYKIMLDDAKDADDASEPWPRRRIMWPSPSSL